MIRMHLWGLCFIVSALALIFCCAKSQAKTYQWTDENGVLHFSDKPPPGQRREKPKAAKSAPSSKKTTPSTQASQGVAPKSTAPSGSGKLFLWKVTSQENTVYLLGSIHLAPPDIYPLDGRIEKAFHACPTVAVEADILKNQAALQAQAMQKGMYGGDDTIENHISQETVGMLKKGGYLNSLTNKMKPWLMAMTIQSQEITKLGLSEQYGVDRFFLKAARVQGKKIVELESVEFQLSMFEKMAAKNPDKYLYYTITQTKKMKPMLDKMLSYWENGQAEAMAKLIFDDLKRYPEFKDIGKTLFYDRNIKMANKINMFLKKGRPYFVIVGAGHLVGSQGIPALLKRKGHKVVQYDGGMLGFWSPSNGREYAQAG